MVRRSMPAVRQYGHTGPCLALLHGGPGAPGYMAPVARRLASAFRVIEPLQRGSGSTPLTVARHVRDLHGALDAAFRGEKIALAGHSWGAMLALAFAAEQPGRISSIALIGCGTFDAAARESLRLRRELRISAELRRRIDALPSEIPDPDERLRALGEMLLPVDSFDPVVTSLELEQCDARAFTESWEDMLRLQGEGTYPAAFSAIDVPVLMLHGAEDPHPGRMIRDSLAPHVAKLEYVEWPRCGHYPWIESAARERFFEKLEAWLSGCGSPGGESEGRR
jgi:pimeloyl-ACP methyl ester carboxylesterase